MKQIYALLGVVVVGASCLVMWNYWSGSKKTDSSNLLIVGTSSDFQPFSFKKDDAIVGFDIDVMHEIAKRLGKEMELQDMPFETLLSALQLGTVHTVAAGLSITPERAERVLFTNPHYSGDPLVMVVVPTHERYSAIEQLAGKRVLVNDGYVADTYMSAFQGPILMRLKTVADALMALKAGHADVFVTAYSTIKPYFDQYGDKEFVYSIIPTTSEQYAFAFPKKYIALRDQVQSTLDDMSRDGTLETLKEKWGLTTKP